MKKIYAALLFMLCATFIYAQTNDFNNSAGDQLWSNSGNWSLGTTPTSANTVRLPLVVESFVDADFTITKLQTTFATGGSNPGGTAIVSGASTLTLDANTANFVAIENVSNNDITMAFAGNLEINNTAGFTLMRMGNGGGNSIMFMDGSTLTLTTNLGTTTGSSSNYNFNGVLAGSGNLRFGPNTINTFGPSANHAGFEGEIVFLGNSVATVNMSDNNVFVPSGTKVQANGNGVLQINGENNYQGFITVGGANTLTFDVNANQNSMETIIFQNNGTLVMDIDPSVANLTFDDNSESDWGSGTLNIIGFSEGVLRFGTDNSGLTSAQLAQITADNGGEALALDADGFLVNESSLSTDQFNLENNVVIYPTEADDVLNFSKPQNSIRIFDLNGRLVLENNKQSQENITVSYLNSGVYIVLLDGNTALKFIKK